MGTIKTRQIKIEWLKNAILSFYENKANKIISKKKLLAQFALNNNSTLRTGEELLELLRLTEFIKINGDEVTK